PNIGWGCAIVGYGGHGADAAKTWGQRRVARVSVEDVYGSLVRLAPIDGISDGGDSGGPLACGGTVVAVDSCGDGASYSEYARLDLAWDWITDTIDGWR